MFLKLGEHASMFFDPTSQVKILPGMVVKVNARQQQSKKLKKAKNAGHVVATTEDEYDEYQESLKNKGSEKTAEVTTDEEVDIHEMKKSELVAHALEVLGDEYTKEDLEGMKKSEIIELLEA